MKRASNIWQGITLGDMYDAHASASRGHASKREVVRFDKDLDTNLRSMYNALRDGTYRQRLEYTSMTKTNVNGKVRHILRPSFPTRIYQHLMLLKIVPLYDRKDPLTALNCKKGCGISATDKRRSLLNRVKNLYYERRDLQYVAYLDQRKSYDHCTVQAFRKGLKMLTDDRQMIDYCVNVTFVEGRLPVGTPASPMAHHIIMLKFDLWLTGVAPFAVRYADDLLMAFETKQEAHQALWRVKQWWWYELGMRAKHTSRVQPIDVPLDFCGYVFHRLPMGDHAKGYTRIRRSTAMRARRVQNDKSWASYFGLMKHADCYSLMRHVEDTMKLKNLTEKVRIDRELDAKHIEMRDVEGIEINILDYQMRCDRNGEPNWIKCLLTMKNEEGQTVAREFHGNYQGIIKFLVAAERAYGKQNLLPLEECRILNQCGYIFENSTNQLDIIEENESDLSTTARV